MTRDLVSQMATDHAKKLPIFWGHGKADPLVNFDLAVMSREFLKANLGIKTVEPSEVLNGGVEFHAYDGMGHSANPEEIHALKEFMKKVIPAQE